MEDIIESPVIAASIDREDKKVIEKKIKSRECFISGESSNGKSDVWTIFSHVLYANTDKRTGYVSCNKCKILLSNLPGTGTSHLKRHKCAVITKGNSSMDEFVTKKIKIKIPEKVSHDAVDECVKFCALDLRSFLAINGDGFKSLCQFLVNTGAKYGAVDVNDVLPNPTTVSRNCIKTATTLRNELMSKLILYIEQKRCSTTTDMWTDNYKKIGYTAVTIHYIDDNWVLNSNILCVRQFPIDQKKSGENVRRSLKDFFSAWPQYDGDDWLSNFVWVTDRGSNIIKALEPNIRLNCSAHIIHNVLQYTFKGIENNDSSQTEEEIDLEPISNLITATKSLIRYMKKSGENNLLSKSLLQSVETRWNSNLAMLQSLFDMYSEVIQLYGQDSRKMSEIDYNLLSKLIDFLAPFKNASTQLEGTSYPTINLVMLHKAKLLKHLLSYKHNRYDDNIQIMFSQLASRSLHAVQEKFKLDKYPEIALFLWLPYKKLKMVDSQIERDQIIENVKVQLHNIQEQMPNNPPENTSQTGNLNYSNEDMFSEWADIDEGSNTRTRYTCEDELSMYQLEHYEPNQNVLQLWKERQIKMPMMAKLAMRIFAIPATSAGSERAFSTSGRVIEERRTCLKGDTVESILFLNDYYKK